MAKNIELKDEITLDEYKAWLTGMLRGKGTKLPDLNDWKAIKKMTDKIIPDVVEVQNPMPWPQPTPYVAPREYEWWEIQPTCIGTGNIDNANNITITNGSCSISMDEKGAVEITSPNTIVIGDDVPPGGVTIGYSECYSGSSYSGGIAPVKKSLEDYVWDTSKYVKSEEAEMAPITEQTLAKYRVQMDKKKEK